jgi:hypothetical protein
VLLYKQFINKVYNCCHYHWSIFGTPLLQIYNINENEEMQDNKRSIILEIPRESACSTHRWFFLSTYDTLVMDKIEILKIISKMKH